MEKCVAIFIRSYKEKGLLQANFLVSTDQGEEPNLESLITVLSLSTNLHSLFPNLISNINFAPSKY